MILVSLFAVAAVMLVILGLVIAISTTKPSDMVGGLLLFLIGLGGVIAMTLIRGTL